MHLTSASDGSNIGTLRFSHASVYHVLALAGSPVYRNMIFVTVTSPESVDVLLPRGVGAVEFPSFPG